MGHVCNRGCLGTGNITEVLFWTGFLKKHIKTIPNYILDIGVAIPNFPENLGREQFLPDASTLLLEFILHKRALKFSRDRHRIIYYAFLSNLNNSDTYVATRTVKTGDSFNPPNTRQNNLFRAPVINTYKLLVSIKDYVILINNTVHNKRTHL